MRWRGTGIEETDEGRESEPPRAAMFIRSSCDPPHALPPHRGAVAGFRFAKRIVKNRKGTALQCLFCFW